MAQRIGTYTEGPCSSMQSNLTLGEIGLTISEQDLRSLEAALPSRMQLRLNGIEYQVTTQISAAQRNMKLVIMYTGMTLNGIMIRTHK